jgi:hypothetical protein
MVLNRTLRTAKVLVDLQGSYINLALTLANIFIVGVHIPARAH